MPATLTKQSTQTVRHPSRNVCVIDIPLKRSTNWSSWFLLSADRHHDNPHSRHDLETKHLKQARQRNAGIIDAGDMLCAMQGKDDRRGSKESLRKKNQRDDYFDSLVDTAVEDYAPYADLFRVIGRGNHETAVLKHHETDLVARVVKGLNKETGSNIQAGGYGGWIVFRFRDGKRIVDRLNLKYFHGTGGGGRATKGVRAVTHRHAQWPDASIVLGGHIHESWLVEVVAERLNRDGSIEFANQTHICTPTYKEEYGDGFGGWHIERDAPPKPLGAWWLRFSFDRYEARVVHELSQAK